MKWSQFATIFVGVLLIAIITPLSQFLTIQTVNADIETATPIAWAVGLIFSILLVVALVKLLTRWQIVSKSNIVILYCMLTLAVPVMNLGLVRPIMLSMVAIEQEYILQGTNTYHKAYSTLDPRWYPVIPTTDALAWNKAYRLITNLDDSKTRKAQTAAAAQLQALIKETKFKMEHPDVAAIADAAAPPAVNPLDLVQKLGNNEVETIDVNNKDINATLTAMGIVDAIEAQKIKTRKDSKEVADKLPEQLAKYDEFALYERFIPADMYTRNRYDLILKEGMSKGDVEALRAQQEELAKKDEKTGKTLRESLIAQVGQLSSGDMTTVRNKVRDAYMQKYTVMSKTQLDTIRMNFIYSLNKNDRSSLFKQDEKATGIQGTPNQNLDAYTKTLWPDTNEMKAQKAKPMVDTWQKINGRIPWKLWLTPMLMWGFLVTVIFMFLMCLAEWLRRKWIERENLAFPLVEVVDNMIRHDYSLETSEDITNPAPRKGIANPMFLIGMLLGATVVFIEAYGFYKGTGTVQAIYFDVSGKLFTSGSFREMSNILFVLSMVVMGLSFLVSLEVSFSIWSIYFLYKVIVLIGKMSRPDLQDSIYTGYAGGRNYPFSMEQLIGACLCFTIVLLIKAFRTPAQTATSSVDTENTFLPKKVTNIGLIVLPIVMGTCFWTMGLRNIPMMILFAVMVLAQVIAMARARAETGLPEQHSSYEFAKLPIVLGLTGITGAKIYISFINIAFLPMTLLFRTLPQHLENMELARRYKIKYKVIAIAGFVAFLVALVVGMYSFIIQSHFWGGAFQGSSQFAMQGPSDGPGFYHYPLWVSHFLGESGLDKFTQPHWIRIEFMVIGFVAFGVLSLLRSRFLNFPIHPIGYLLILISIYYEFCSPYYKGDGTGIGKEESWLWGSVLLAWLLKKLIIKYGGMNTYKQAKPLFIGLVIGAVVCVFGWNMVDLVCSWIGINQADPNKFVQMFLQRVPFSPRFY
ncbi:MAG: DUF6785 family protein [bacterium]